MISDLPSNSQLTLDLTAFIDMIYIFFRYPTCFVIGIILIVLVFAFLGYATFHKNVRTEAITPKREENGHDGHYEMKNTVLASS